MPMGHADMAGVNRRRLVAEVLRRGSASRAALAKITGLSAPTVGKAADGLIADGLLEEFDPAGDAIAGGAAGPREAPPAGVGRPARPLRISRSRPSLVAVQLGVRHTRVAALPVAGPTDESWPVRFDTPGDPETWLLALRRAADDLPLRRPVAVAVGVPGVVEEDTGRVLLSPNLHWTESVAPADLVRRVWKAPVVSVQEIRALALGHLSVEASASGGSTDFLLVDVGEGVGSAAVLRGRLTGGALPLSGELGHTPVRGNARRCGCGGVGCLETLLSRRGLAASAARAHPGRRWRFARLSEHVAEVGVERWLARTLDAAGVVIAGALNVLGIREVVVTGALGELPPVVLERLAQAIDRSAMWARFGRVGVRPAPRRWGAGLVSALLDRALLPALPMEVR